MKKLLTCFEDAFAPSVKTTLWLLKIMVPISLAVIHIRPEPLRRAGSYQGLRHLICQSGDGLADTAAHPAGYLHVYLHRRAEAPRLRSNATTT